MTIKIHTDPGNVIIEKTAGEFAGVFFDAARSSGMKVIMLQNQKINLMVFKSPRAFARRHLEKFIPAAVHSLIEIMSRPNTPADQKELIYNALMERVNDEGLKVIGTMAGLPEFQNTPLYKPDTELPKPVIIDNRKIAHG